MLTTWLSFFFLACATAIPQKYSAHPFARDPSEKRTTSDHHGDVTVDLGYEVYQGIANESTGLTVFKGIRYAAAPTGQNRWQAPQAPLNSHGGPILTDAWAPQCPQSPRATSGISLVNNSESSEDCLFLNVFIPTSIQEPLPVLVWIHGGGYGSGNGRVDFSALLASNDNAFIGVGIQYRLGAFGFLSSDEIYKNGVANAGLLDQAFALQWVQKYIHLFGGDPDRVTIAGESAGGGSVMLLDMAYGGTWGDKLFAYTIVSSPYLPMQYNYDDPMPSQFYNAFAEAAGCSSTNSGENTENQSILHCLQAADTEILINASANISQSGGYGTWAFLPVTDGTFVKDLPSQQLSRKQVNGRSILVGNNANEGSLFVPQNITTEDELVSWIRFTFPLFNDNDISELLETYPSPSTPDDPSDPLYATSGDESPTAVNQSSVATGHQQRANNIYAETTFVCPSYWLTEAYANNNVAGGAAYKYQFSVPPAEHGSDVEVAFGEPEPTPPFSSDFISAFQQIWGHFIVHGNPSVASTVATSAVTRVSREAATNPLSSWPTFTVDQPLQIDLNQSMPVPEDGYNENVTAKMVRNDFRLVDAFSWEGDRGARCDFWRRKAEVVPE